MLPRKINTYVPMKLIDLDNEVTSSEISFPNNGRPSDHSNQLLLGPVSCAIQSYIHTMLIQIALVGQS